MFVGVALGKDVVQPGVDLKRCVPLCLGMLCLDAAHLIAYFGVGRNENCEIS